MRTQRSQARPCCPLLKLLLIKKSIIPAPPPSANSKTNKEVTEFLYEAAELPTSDCSILTENEGLVQITVTITNHDFGPDYKLH